MDQILCPRCGATVHWDGYSKIVKCEYCETEYSMHPRDNVRGMQQGMPEYGDGTVVPMTIYGDTMIRDRMFMKAYVPSGWRITTGTIERFDMIGTPFVPSFRLDSPDGKTFILFRGACKYKHIEPGRMTQQLQDKLDFGPHNPISPSYYRLKTYMNAQEYCDHMATTDSGLTGVSLAGEKQADNAASHNRVANLNSEMIRGVNTYYGSDGVVEASTMYDHVYQYNQNPDIYAAQVGHYFTPGVDFTELKKTNGDY